ncbi:MAG: TIGR03663 family protein [Acidobacteriia bacterium]|nr:TIGR03663 family protein [Terriglobia bacterium]
MAQVSAKAARKKIKTPAPAAASATEARPSVVPQRRFSWPNAWWWMGAGLLLAAAALRLYDLSAKVMHHDEGVNGVFTSTLFHQGGYKYNPDNFHGPSLYYAALLTTSINSFFYGREGLSTFAVRLVPAIFGIGVVWLLLCLRRQLGTSGALSAAAIAAVSAGMVFFSRYFIHEIMFVFFTLAIIVAWLRYRETSQPRHFILASASAALLCATKETWIITAAVLLLAIPCTVVYLGLRGNPDKGADADKKNRGELAPQNAKLFPAWSQRRLYLTAAIVFVAVWVLLYSSFFMNFPKGVEDSISTFRTWFHTGQQRDHMHPWSTYFTWMWLEDGPILVLGAIGVVVALFRATNRFAVFTAFWAMGILAAYSLVPYKTPWLALSILLPLIIVAGYALGQCSRGWQRAAAMMALAASCGWSAYQAIDLSFFSYDDDVRHPYVYAHTKRDFLGLVDDVESIAAHTRQGKQIGITIMAPEHWPLPWYLRDYPNAGYWGQVVTNNVQPIIIAYDTQIAEVNRLFGDKYRIISSHYLRGNQLVLYLRNDLQP